MEYRNIYPDIGNLYTGHFFRKYFSDCIHGLSILVLTYRFCASSPLHKVTVAVDSSQHLQLISHSLGTGIVGNAPQVADTAGVWSAMFAMSV
ncbi:MAG: hypothetical protein F6K11_32355 [Leptolyngbya sp. SIO3F4]|nr:hypothetical protein [Leptolyngbya sp. SIO3F4]